MADPVLVTCTKDTWVKVATNVTTGLVWKTNENPNYLQTYVMTGNPAPSDLSKAVPIDTWPIPISATAGIDVYIYAQGAAGEIRIDL